MDPALRRAIRYTAWLRRHWVFITVVGAVTFATSTWLAAFKLPLHGDLAHLLPPDAPAVRDLRTLEGRVVAQDAMLVLVEDVSVERRTVYGRRVRPEEELAAPARKRKVKRTSATRDAAPAPARSRPEKKARGKTQRPVKRRR